MSMGFGKSMTYTIFALAIQEMGSAKTFIEEMESLNCMQGSLNGQLSDNVQIDCGFDRSNKLCFSGHV